MASWLSKLFTGKLPANILSSTKTVMRNGIKITEEVTKCGVGKQAIKFKHSIIKLPKNHRLRMEYGIKQFVSTKNLTYGSGSVWTALGKDFEIRGMNNIRGYVNSAFPKTYLAGLNKV